MPPSGDRQAGTAAAAASGGRPDLRPGTPLRSWCVRAGFESWVTWAAPSWFQWVGMGFRPGWLGH